MCKATLAAWGMHLDFAPDIAGGAVFPYLESMANQSFGMVLGKGGADTMIRALEKMVIAAGGKIFTGAEVAEITMSGGKATGVRLASGETHTAAKAVIAGVAPGALAGQAAAERLGRRRLRHGDEEIPPRAGHDDDPSGARRSAGLDGRRRAAGSSPMSISRPSLDAMARTYQQAMAGLLPAEPVLVVGQPTAIDPSRAPAGQACAVGAGARAAGRDRGRCGGRDRAGHWDEVKEAYADRVLDIIESYAPGLQAKDPRPRGVLAHRSRARESEPRRRRPDLRQPPSVAELPVSPGARLRAAGTRRSKDCIWSAPPPGRAPASAQARASCSRSNLAGG